MCSSDDSTSMTTLDKHQTDSTGKTPHSWTNTWRYYNFSPTFPMSSNPYSTWTRPYSDQRRNRHNVSMISSAIYTHLFTNNFKQIKKYKRMHIFQRVEPYPGTIMMYPSELSIPRPQVAPVGYSSSFYY